MRSLNDPDPFVSTSGLPTLTRDGVTLREHRWQDAAGMAERIGDPLTQRWTTMPVAATEQACLEWVDQIVHRPRPDMVHFAIEVEGRYAGDVGLSAGEDGPFVFFNTSPWVRGRGVAAVAAATVSDWALGALGWSKVVWAAEVGNIASAKTAWRAGFPRARARRDSMPSPQPPHELVDAWWSVKTSPAAEPVVSWWGFLAPKTRPGNDLLLAP